MKSEAQLLQGCLWFVMLGMLRLVFPGSAQAGSALLTSDNPPSDRAGAIPWSQLGARAGANYTGEGLAVSPIGTGSGTEAGARLRCVFQQLEGQTSLTVQAFDRHDVAIQGATDQINITYSGALPVNHPVINEWMARNSANLADPADGDFDDWIELYNPWNTSIDLSGYKLADDSDPTKWWTIPDETMIAPGGYLLIWADEETGQNGRFGPGGDLHASFSLDADGEAIGLYRPDQSQVDVLTFGPQNANVSQGRYPDGAATIQPMATPTPRLPNRYP